MQVDAKICVMMLFSKLAPTLSPGFLLYDCSLPCLSRALRAYTVIPFWGAHYKADLEKRPELSAAKKCGA